MAKKRKDTELRSAQAISVVHPIAMTLAKLPANRSGFKVIRSDDKEQETEKMAVAPNDRKRSKKKTVKRDESLYMIRLPDGISETEAQIYLEAFAMTEDYDVWQAEDGSYWLRRKNIANLDELVAAEIDMGGGFVAHIDVNAFERNEKATDGFHGAKLVQLEFDGYSLEDTKEWLDENRCDFKEGGIEVVDGGVIVSRHSHNKADGRKVRIGEGVTGIVVRADVNDIPVHLYRAVIEESYGYYGIGLLDFSQYLAAPYYADATWDGIYALREVLENVTLYSGLPLAERAALVDNALTQFGTYYKALIEAMPREMVQAAQRFDKQTQEADKMAKKDSSNTEQRTDDQTAADKAADVNEQERTDEGTTADPAVAATDNAADPATTEQRTDEPQYVTKDEVAEVVGAAVAAAFANRHIEDAAAAAADSASAKGEEAARTDDPSESDKKLADGITSVAKAVTGLVERVDSLATKLDEYGETVEARSEPDGDGSPPAEGAGKGKDPFVGMMGAIGGLRQSQ